jgi:glycosyltransferase involved in cell wall biosynthesis
MTTQRRVLAWKVNIYDPELASVRYRCLYPGYALRQLGWQSFVLERDETISDFSTIAALIVVKAFENRDRDLVKQASGCGVPVVFDLCDNIFVKEYGGDRHGLIEANFREMARHANVIITPTEPLGRTIRTELGDGPPVVVIPDTVETAEVLAVSLEGSMRLAARRAAGVRVHAGSAQDGSSSPEKGRSLRTWLAGSALTRVLRDSVADGGLRRRLFTSPRKTEGPSGDMSVTVSPSLSGERTRSVGSRRTVVWFGNAGSQHGLSGLRTLAQVSPAIVRAAHQEDFRLQVISNDRRQFDELIAPLKVESEYREWTLQSAADLISLADVCLIPNSRDAFSQGKSANRAVLALHLGVPVVATSTEALAPIAACLISDDFEHGILTYLRNASRREQDLRRAREVIEAVYSPGTVGSAWAGVLSDLVDVDRSTRLLPWIVGAGESAPHRLLIFCPEFSATQEIHFLRPLRGAQQKGACQLALVNESQLARIAPEGRSEEVMRLWREFRPTVAILSRYAGPDHQILIDVAMRHGTPIVVHLDDDLFDVPAELGRKKREFHNSTERQTALRQACRFASVIYVPTERLAERIREYGFPGEVVFPPIQVGADPDELKPHERRAGVGITIGYMGTASHQHDLAMVVPALAALLETQDVRFETFGTVAMPRELERFGSQVNSVPPVADYSRFLQALRELKWDVGLAPLREIPFNSFRTYTKWLEYTMAGVPVLASDCEVYRSVIDSDAGSLVDDERWGEALEEMIRSAALREVCVRQAQHRVRRDFRLEALGESVLNVERIARRRAGEEVRAV